MADELKLFANPQTDTGLTVIARVFDEDGVQVGGDVSCSEVGSSAIYLGNMPTAGAARYYVRYLDGVVLLAQEELDWDGTQEIIPGNTIVDGDVTEIQAQRLILSALAGKVSGAGTSNIVFRDVNDTTDRIAAVVDTDGNRKQVTLDGD